VNRVTWGHKSYVLARGAAAVLALSFALFYSKELGVLGRSYLVMIMTLSVLVAISITSGTTLTLRNLASQKNSSQNMSSFHSLIVLETLVGVSVFSTLLIVFSSVKYTLHPTVISMASIYFISSTAHLVTSELLISKSAFGILAVLDVMTIILQFFLYLILKNLTDFTLLSDLLLSFIFSYSVIAVLGLTHLRNHFGHNFSFRNPLFFFNLSRGNHSLGIVLGIVDRLDRLIIAWFLPISFLGKYAVMSGAISFFRFIPEATGKLIVSLKSNFWQKHIAQKSLLLGVFAFMVIVVFSSQLLIGQILGADWLLPWSVTLAFALQELARGAFLISGNYTVSVGNSTHIHRAALCLLLISIPLTFSLAKLKGLIGVPLGLLLSYLVVLLFLRQGGKGE
jgi:hypothetical protein